METLELSEVREGVVLADDDSQQAAEAMVQLGNVGFYMGEQLQQGKRAEKYRVNDINLKNNVSTSNNENFRIFYHTSKKMFVDKRKPVF